MITYTVVSGTCEAFLPLGGTSCGVTPVEVYLRRCACGHEGTVAMCGPHAAGRVCCRVCYGDHICPVTLTRQETPGG